MNDGTTFLRLVDPGQVALERRDAADPSTLETVQPIVDDVRDRGLDAVRHHAERLGDLEPGADLVIGPEALEEALDGIRFEDRELLERVAHRIRVFAEAQRASLEPVVVAIPGGRAGHDVEPVERAGCYAPGGRFPLPSSVLMTAVTARASGVAEVWLASPRPAPVTLAAAAVARVDGLLAAGGAHAVAALAHGAGPVPACDIVVGPGNRWVTAAKKVVSGRVAIDMLAGPSELVVLADATADPALVAADLVAQAEHDPEAIPVLVTTYEPLIGAVRREIARQLEDLPTAGTAHRALHGGFCVLAADMDEAVEVVDGIAPEHLEVLTEDPVAVGERCRHWGGLFLGPLAAEVLGDYGAGPNHTLPTSGTARWTGGLSVLDFLRVRTWMRLDDPRRAAGLVDDAERLARLEGLEAHARAASMRRR